MLNKLTLIIRKVTVTIGDFWHSNRPQKKVCRVNWNVLSRSDPTWCTTFKSNYPLLFQVVCFMLWTVVFAFFHLVLWYINPELLLTSDFIAQTWDYVNLFYYNVDTFQQSASTTSVEKLEVIIITIALLALALFSDKNWYILQNGFDLDYFRLYEELFMVCILYLGLWNSWLLKMVFLKSNVGLYFGVTGRFTGKDRTIAWLGEPTVLKLVEVANSHFTFIAFSFFFVVFMVQAYLVHLLKVLHFDQRIYDEDEKLPWRNLFVTLTILSFFVDLWLCVFIVDACQYMHSCFDWKMWNIRPHDPAKLSFLVSHVPEPFMHACYKSTNDIVRQLDHTWHHCGLHVYLEQRVRLEWLNVYNDFYVNNGLTKGRKLVLEEVKKWIEEYCKTDEYHQPQLAEKVEEPKEKTLTLAERVDRIGIKVFWSVVGLYIIVVLFTIFGGG